MRVTIGSETYDWDGDYTFQEGVAIEKITGVSFLDWLERMNPGDSGKRASVTDIGVLLWIVARRTHPDLTFEEFDFPLDQWSMVDDGARLDPTQAVVASSSDVPSI